jgi:hypothetical protein
MLQYSDDNFQKIIDEIAGLTKQIENLLSSENKLNLQQIESLDQFYKKKAHPLKILEEWITDDKLKSEIHKKYSKVLQDIADNDKVQLDRVGAMLSKSKKKLKNATDKKSLLIYSKAK